LFDELKKNISEVQGSVWFAISIVLVSQLFTFLYFVLKETRVFYGYDGRFVVEMVENMTDIAGISWVHRSSFRFFSFVKLEKN
jgi:hypothetical protein